MTILYVYPTMSIILLCQKGISIFCISFLSNLELVIIFPAVGEKTKMHHEYQIQIMFNTFPIAFCVILHSNKLTFMVLFHKHKNKISNTCTEIFKF